MSGSRRRRPTPTLGAIHYREWLDEISNTCCPDMARLIVDLALAYSAVVSLNDIKRNMFSPPAPGTLQSRGAIFFPPERPLRAYESRGRQ